MDRSVLIQNGLKPNWQQIALFLIAATIPLTIPIGNLGLILSAIFALVVGILHKVQIKDFFQPIFLFPVLFFMWILTSALLSKDSAAGLKQVDKALLYLLITMVFFVFQQTARFNVRKILKVFALITFLTTFIYIVSGLWSIYSANDHNAIFFHRFSEIFDQHAIYVALYISLSIFVLTKYNIIEPCSAPVRILTILVISVLLAGLFFTASKSVLVIFALLYPIQIITGLKWRYTKAIALLLFGLITFVMVRTPAVKERFEKGLEFNISAFQPTKEVANAKVFTNEEKRAISDLELRYIMAKIGLYHIFNDGAFWFGYGMGDVQHYIDYYYMFYGLAPNWFEGYNLHNQYLQIFISMGLFALLFFLIYLGYSIKKAFDRGDSLHMLFLISVIFVFVFECLLSRNKGIVFFFFFNTLFLLNTDPLENCNSRDTRHP